MSFLKRHWETLVTICGCLLFAFLAHLSYEYVFIPNSPQMIIDLDVPSQRSPVDYEPIEITGASEGKVVICPCKVDEIYASYVHYPDNWEHNILNPEAKESKIFLYSLYFVAVCSAGSLGWYISKRIKERNKEDKEHVA